VAKYTRLTSAYQDQQAAGLMTLQELGAKLEELEKGHKMAERELMALKSHQQRVEELEKDRDALLQGTSKMVPSALDNLDGEEKNRLYQMLRLEVTPSEEGYEVGGAFCTSRLTSPLARRKESEIGMDRFTSTHIFPKKESVLVVRGRGEKTPCTRI
jgi:hypothetical protein